MTCLSCTAGGCGCSIVNDLRMDVIQQRLLYVLQVEGVHSAKGVMPPLSGYCLVVDESTVASLILVVAPAVDIQGYPELKVGLNTWFIPSTFLHGGEDAVSGFINLLPHEVFVFDDVLFGFGGNEGDEQVESMFIFHQCEGFIVGGVHGGLCICETLVCEEVEFAEFTFTQFAQGKGQWDDGRSAGHGDVGKGKELVAILFMVFLLGFFFFFFLSPVLFLSFGVLLFFMLSG